MSLSRGSDNSVKGNYLGINAAGTGRPPAPVGTSFSFSNGMGIGLTTNTTIGGPEAGARNVIVASGYNISINDQTNDNTIASGGTLVQGNYLGTNAHYSMVQIIVPDKPVVDKNKLLPARAFG